MLAQDSKLRLFPLNTVLFPGMMLPLHIFEDRYKAMIKACLADDNTFGVVLAKTRAAQAPNVTKLFMDDLYNIGTTAHITAVERLADERLNLITVGQERFIIKNIQASEADFLIGEVDPLPMQGQDDPMVIQNLTTRLKPMVQQYIDHLAEASGEDLAGAKLPTDPKALAYLAGTAVQGPLHDKQRLLAAESLSLLISKTVNVLDRENKILAYMLKAYQLHQQIRKPLFTDYSLN